MLLETQTRTLMKLMINKVLYWLTDLTLRWKQLFLVIENCVIGSGHPTLCMKNIREFFNL